MVRVKLCVKLTTENIRGLVLDIKEYKWIFVITCSKCGHSSDKEVCFYTEDEQPLMKGTCTFTKSCKDCKNEMRMNILKETNTPIEI